MLIDMGSYDAFFCDLAYYGVAVSFFLIKRPSEFRALSLLDEIFAAAVRVSQPGETKINFAVAFVPAES
ncbi:hypothetical protein N7462_008252 [Penicillium macrosclerotiorum]|uniref:uncharacterized protein n=1 Tax=Penicillium macrosclerotiorum TaxID=303699 RepID=UPI002547A514|nr:uncharacterized protein N7462_008252 [Penicillium macrosclerotiorum]KAJ5675355.1 hypothetical protein N7462_008252 [Penicillium macrosclerotiorum]